MALTRKDLEALGLTEDQIDTIIGKHAATIEGIKSERDSLKDAADELKKAQGEVARLTSELEAAKKTSGDAAKVQADFDAYKAKVDLEKANAAKMAALRKAFKAGGVARDEFADLLAGKVDLAAVELDGDSVKDADKLIAPLKASYAGCFAQEDTKGVPPAAPPTGGGKLSGVGKALGQSIREFKKEVKVDEPAKTEEEKDA